MLDLVFTSFPVLETKHFLLRQVMTEDLPHLLFLRSDEDVMKYVDKEKMVSLDEAAALVQKIDQNFEKGEGVSWAVCTKEKNEMIGQAGIWRIDKEHHRGEIGYTLHPSYWNKGVMSEVLTKIIHYGFYELDLHSLEANVNSENQASIRVLEKMGFVREAYFRENYYFRGKFLDSVIYSLITPKS